MIPKKKNNNKRLKLYKKKHQKNNVHKMLAMNNNNVRTDEILNLKIYSRLRDHKKKNNIHRDR